MGKISITEVSARALLMVAVISGVASVCLDQARAVIAHDYTPLANLCTNANRAAARYPGSCSHYTALDGLRPYLGAAMMIFGLLAAITLISSALVVLRVAATTQQPA